MKRIILFALMLIIGTTFAQANFTLNLNDDGSGVTYKDAYWVLSIDSLSSDYAVIFLSVFCSKEIYQAKKHPIKNFRVYIDSSNPVFPVYFSKEAMTGPGKNIFDNSQNYVLSFDGTQGGETSGLDFTLAIPDQN